MEKRKHLVCARVRTHEGFSGKARICMSIGFSARLSGARCFSMRERHGEGKCMTGTGKYSCSIYKVTKFFQHLCLISAGDQSHV